jgi:hypothetical protein
VAETRVANPTCIQVESVRPSLGQTGNKPWDTNPREILSENNSRETKVKTV